MGWTGPLQGLPPLSGILGVNHPSDGGRCTGAGWVLEEEEEAIRALELMGTGKPQGAIRGVGGTPLSLIHISEPTRPKR